MPRMSGLAVLGQLRKVNPTLTVVIISGYVTDDLHRAAVQLSVAPMLKPDPLCALIPAIERLLARIRPEALDRSNTV